MDIPTRNLNSEEIYISEKLEPDSDDEQHLDSDDDENFESVYHDQMKMELEGTSLSKSFVHQEQSDAASTKQVDLDLNLVTHLLESFASQDSLQGPASNILRDLGLKIPS